MTRSAYLLCCAAMLFAASLGGCSLVVDFDRSLLVDAAVDPSPDAGVDALLTAIGARTPTPSSDTIREPSTLTVPVPMISHAPAS